MPNDLDVLLQSGGDLLYEVVTQAAGPAGALPLTDELLLERPSGDIFGGWVLSQMDIAAGITAGQRAQGRVATIAIEAMKFIRPVHVGDVLCVYAKIARTGRTSMTIELEAWALRNRIGQRVKVTEGVFTFVAIDDEGQPRPLP